MPYSRLTLAELHQVLLVAVATSAMRHELRNKLGSLRNAAFFLKRKFDGSAPWNEDVRVPRFFQIIESEIAAADQIIAAGMSQVLSEPELASVDTAEVVRKAVAAIVAPAGVSVGVSGGGWVTANGSELEVGLRCLLDNALEALASAGGAVEVRCAEAGAGFVAIEVVDDGPGFAGGEVAPWLLPFATSKPGRLGLGLSVARRVAARAGGTLDVTSAPGGRGVRTSIVIPMARREEGTEHGQPPRAAGG